MIIKGCGLNGLRTDLTDEKDPDVKSTSGAPGTRVKIAVDQFERTPRFASAVNLWLGDLCDSSAFVHFPFSGKGWTEKIHPMVVEQPAEFINR